VRAEPGARGPRGERLISKVHGRIRLLVTARHQHILFWGGLRGALALALALGLPAEMPAREEIITAAFAVVAFSIFVQGLTMTPLIHGRRLLCGSGDRAVERIALRSQNRLWPHCN